MSATSFFSQKHAELLRCAAGAEIALLAEGDRYVATMSCAVKARKVAGTLGVWKELDPGASQISFPTQGMMQVLKTLSRAHSVAIMERVTHPAGTFGPPYAAIWVVPKQTYPTPNPRPGFKLAECPVSVNGERATYEASTGQVSWPRAIGSWTCNLRETFSAPCLDPSDVASHTVFITECDGKIIRFYEPESPSEEECGTCHNDRVVGHAPDDYFPCPECCSPEVPDLDSLLD